jgi:CBS domain-containing protein
MITVGDLLKIKGNQIWSVNPNTSVLEALKMMAEKGAGALLVLENQKLSGIISERDFVRSIAATEQCLLNANVEGYMTKEVFTIRLGQTIEEVMQLMTEKRIRHLPVVENDVLMGLISVGDVVKQVIASKDSDINNLENYIQGRGYSQ